MFLHTALMRRCLLYFLSEEYLCKKWKFSKLKMGRFASLKDVVINGNGEPENGGFLPKNVYGLMPIIFTIFFQEWRERNIMQIQHQVRSSGCYLNLILPLLGRTCLMADTLALGIL